MSTSKFEFWAFTVFRTLVIVTEDQFTVNRVEIISSLTAILVISIRVIKLVFIRFTMALARYASTVDHLFKVGQIFAPITTIGRYTGTVLALFVFPVTFRLLFLISGRFIFIISISYLGASLLLSRS